MQLDRQQPYVVGIGASAGGLEALQKLLPTLPTGSRFAYVVVQHLSPTHRSLLVELLRKSTTMAVVPIEHGMQPAAGSVYITPPNRNVALDESGFVLTPVTDESGPKPSVNHFLVSLAAMCEERAIAIILSGTGSDGALGVRAVHAAGGYTFAQTLDTAKYAGMPQAAMETAMVDLALAPEEIGARLRSLAENGVLTTAQPLVADGDALKRLLGFIRTRTYLDFSGYKQATFERRLERRMETLQLPDLDSYVAHVEAHPEETERLAQELLISVTSFFRDRSAFRAIDRVLGDLAALKRPEQELRIWVAGCASGEEAYSLAILALKHVDALNKDVKVRVFASDVDERALANARRGEYPTGSLAALSAEELHGFFEIDGDRATVRKRLRDAVVFARQDLLQDPPFIRLDLVSCRNVLIYFQTDVQARVLGMFHRALRAEGFLFLGRSESVLQQADAYEPIDTGSRIFRARSGARSGEFAWTRTVTPPHDRARAESSSETRSKERFEREVLAALSDRLLPPGVVTNAEGKICFVNGAVGDYLALSPGAARFDLAATVRQELKSETQTLLFRAERGSSAVSGAARRLGGRGSRHAVRVHVHPLSLPRGDHLYYVGFERVNVPVRSERATPRQDAERKRLEDELVATREHLQAVIEELETSNEELQALNEEVQSSNEEMQSSNEELESSNEELQSTNEELTTVNEELQNRTQELVIASQELELVQESLDFPLLLLDDAERVTRANRAAIETFGWTVSKVGRWARELPVPSMFAGVPERIAELAEAGVPAREAVSVGERRYLLSVAPCFAGESRRGTVVTLIDDTVAARAEQAIERSRGQLLAIMNYSLALMAVQDSTGRFEFVNSRFAQFFRRTPEELVRAASDQLMSEAEAAKARRLEETVLRSGRPVETEETFRFPDGDRVLLSVRFPLYGEDGSIRSIGYQAIDITERKQTEDRLRVTARVFDRAAEGVMILDVNWRFVLVNDAFTTITRYQQGDIIGKGLDELFLADGDLALLERLQAGLLERGSWQGEFLARKKDGERFEEWLSLNTVRDAEGTVLNYVGIFTDITEVRRAQRHAEFLATHDALTGLPNRTLLLDRIEACIRRAERQSGLNLALIFIDLDGFKYVNDTLGHGVGDELLKQTAERLRHATRAADSLARLGGDEFVALLEIADKDEAALAAQRIVEAFRESFRLGDQEVFVSTSAGISLFPHDAHDAYNLLRHADAAMYRAKRQGKNNFQFFAHEMAEGARRRLMLDAALRRALADGELTLKFQPQIDLRSGRVRGAEVLLRWTTAPDGELGPEHFIPIAEETGVIAPLTDWILEAACQQLNAWEKDGRAVPRLFVNLSAHHLLHGDVVASVRRALRRFALSGERLGVELTESAIAQNPLDAARVMKELAEFGVLVSIDDFGTGYSSLSYLKQYPVHELKIDRSFVDGIAESSDDRTIAAAIIAMARALGIVVVAEGLETQAQFDELRSLGCDVAQGFLIAHPMDAPAFEQWYAAHGVPKSAGVH